MESGWRADWLFSCGQRACKPAAALPLAAVMILLWLWKWGKPPMWEVVSFLSLRGWFSGRSIRKSSIKDIRALHVTKSAFPQCIPCGVEGCWFTSSSGASQMDSENDAICRGQGETEEAGHSGLVGGRFNKQGNLHRRLAWAAARLLVLCTCLLSRKRFYRNFDWV